MRRSIVISLKRHWRALTAACGALALVVVATVALWPVSIEERVDRIRPGMNKAEVEKIMGVPHGNYSRETIIHHGGGAGVDPADNLPLRWKWDDATVEVWFNQDGQVIQTAYRPHPLSLSDRLGLLID